MKNFDEKFIAVLNSCSGKSHTTSPILDRRVLDMAEKFRIAKLRRKKLFHRSIYAFLSTAAAAMLAMGIYIGEDFSGQSRKNSNPMSISQEKINDINQQNLLAMWDFNDFDENLCDLNISVDTYSSISNGVYN